MLEQAPEPYELRISEPSPETLRIELGGNWRLQSAPPDLDAIASRLPGIRRIVFDTARLAAWDSVLLIFLARLRLQCEGAGIDVDQTSLPEGVQRLLALAAAVPERQGSRRVALESSVVARIGAAGLAAAAGIRELCAFIGEAALALGKLATGRARYRRADFFLIVQECGAQALPIVSLISFLVGMILAYVGAVQLKQFGAQIFVANLVGLGMAREMGAMMTAIIMAGRTGAAFAAQLGTMTVGEEIDALRTSGISPMEFLVLPRILALVLMVPLLCLYADLLGILGGALVAVSSFDLGLAQYYDQTRAALDLQQFALGLFKAAVFGILIALAGCLRGMQCGRSASAVGAAATSAVVTGIVWIIVFDAALTVAYDVLGW